MTLAPPTVLPALQIHQELHARVAEPVRVPCRIRHSAYLLPDGPSSRDEVRHSFELVASGLRVAKQNILWGERSGRLETALGKTSRLRVVWELHTEFYSYTSYHWNDAAAGGGTGQAIVEPFLLPAMPTLGTKLVDLDIAVSPGTELTAQLAEFLGAGPIYGGMVVGGQGRVWTGFQVNEWGQGRYAVAAGDLGDGRMGALIRRLVEIENYYHLILLPLEVYRAQVGPLRAMEARITQRSREIAQGLEGPQSGVDEEHHWLVALTREQASLTQLTEHMRHELSAAESYYAIFEERLRWLHEPSDPGFQTIEEFLTARVGPAVRNYRNFSERAAALAAQIASMGNMLRTRINLNVERQGLETMRAMDRRFELQLHLQFTVEGLSVIVLSYYLTGLVGYCVKAVDALWHLPAKPDLWIALMLPVAVGLSYVFTRRVKGLVKRYVQGGSG